MTAAVPVKTTPPAVRIDHTPDVITITDANTTIGYCRYEESGEIEYVFLNPAHRRKGDATLLLQIVEQRLGTTLRFQPPISPLGRQLIDFYQTVSVGWLGNGCVACGVAAFATIRASGTRPELLQRVQVHDAQSHFPKRKAGSFYPPQRTLMGPGPSDIHPRVLSAMGRPTIGYLDPVFAEMMEELKKLLRYAFQTKNALAFRFLDPARRVWKCAS